MEVGPLQFSIICLALLLVVGGIGGIGFLYWKSYPRFESRNLDELHPHIIEMMHMTRHDPNLYAAWVARYLDLCGDLIPDTFSKRQNFWTTYIQFSLSLLVVVFITVLLLLKIVSAEAGLPILAALGGAAISQGISSVGGPTRSRTDPHVIGRRE
jgi:hypothetical protein